MNFRRGPAIRMHFLVASVQDAPRISAASPARYRNMIVQKGRETGSRNEACPSAPLNLPGTIGIV